LNADFSEERILLAYLINLFCFIIMNSIAILISESPYSGLFKATYSQGFSELEAKDISRHHIHVPVFKTGNSASRPNHDQPRCGNISKRYAANSGAG
jgi:hypothetical protein